MAVAVWLIARGLGESLAASAPLVTQLVALAITIVLGLLIYFALVHFSGAQRLDQLIRIRRAS
jgi:hypothetical protein